jgi:hypothetical protein
MTATNADAIEGIPCNFVLWARENISSDPNLKHEATGDEVAILEAACRNRLPVLLGEPTGCAAKPVLWAMRQAEKSGVPRSQLNPLDSTIATPPQRRPSSLSKSPTSAVV